MAEPVNISTPAGDINLVPPSTWSDAQWSSFVSNVRAAQAAQDAAGMQALLQEHDAALRDTGQVGIRDDLSKPAVWQPLAMLALGAQRSGVAAVTMPGMPGAGETGGGEDPRVGPAGEPAADSAAAGRQSAMSDLYDRAVAAAADPAMSDFNSQLDDAAATGEDASTNYEARMNTPGYTDNNPKVLWVWNAWKGRYESWARPETPDINFESEVVARWDAMSPADQAVWKEMLYWSGFYDEGFVPRYDAFALRTDSDDIAMARALEMWDRHPSRDFDDIVGQMASAGSAAGVPYLYGGDEALDAQDVDPVARAEARSVRTSNEVAVRSFMQANGIDVSDKFVKKHAEDISLGLRSMEEFQDIVRREYVVSSYPGVTDRVLAGENIDTIASPYVSAYAAVMGLDDSEVDVANPFIQKALQGTGDGRPVPLWQFKESIVASPEYQGTSDYKQGYINFVNSIKDMMGM